MNNYLIFESYLRTQNIPFEKEVQFAKHLGRKWKTDYMFCFPNGTRLAVEIEGGAFTGGRHTQGEGFVGDMQKYNAYTALGIKLLRFTPEQIEKEIVYVVNLIRLVGEGAQPTKEMFAIKEKSKSRRKTAIKRKVAIKTKAR